MSMPGPFELLLIFAEILILFGGKKLPEVGRALGEGIKEFKKALKDGDSQDKKENRS